MSRETRDRSGRGRLVVISGPSGCGKTTICKALAEDPSVVLAVSATTRQQRAGEVEGVDYYFLDATEFERRVANGEFLEHANYNGHRYGTLRSVVRDQMALGKTVILEIEVQGTRLLRRQNVEATYVFLMPPSLAVLEERLRGRKTEDEVTIRKRIEIARNEMDMAHLYDTVVINRGLADAIREVRGVLGMSRAGGER